MTILPVINRNASQNNSLLLGVTRKEAGAVSKVVPPAFDGIVC